LSPTTKSEGSGCWCTFCTVTRRSRTSPRCNGFLSPFAVSPQSPQGWCSKLAGTAERSTPTSSLNCRRKPRSVAGCSSTNPRRAIPVRPWRPSRCPLRPCPLRQRRLPLRTCPRTNLHMSPARSRSCSGLLNRNRDQPRPAPLQNQPNRLPRLLRIFPLRRTSPPFVRRLSGVQSQSLHAPQSRPDLHRISIGLQAPFAPISRPRTFLRSPALHRSTAPSPASLQVFSRARFVETGHLMFLLYLHPRHRCRRSLPKKMSGTSPPCLAR